MKPLSKSLLVLAACVSIAELAGCAIVPAEPGYVYAAPPAATVVVRPAYRPYYYGYGPRWHGGRW
jgi:hypothetical protein